MSFQTHTVTGAGGVRLFVETAGDSTNRSIVFFHGFCQSRLSWQHQFASTLADEFYLVRVDMRGHGDSDKPEDLSAYQDDKNWADDIQAIITTLGLDHPVLVGSSYGGIVFTDYLRHHGDGAIGGLVYVGAGTETGSEQAGRMLGEEFMQLGAGLLSENVGAFIAASRRYIELETHTPMPPEEFYTTLGFNVIVPLHVRQGMLMRQTTSADVLGQVRVPVQVLHGAEDQIVLPKFGEFVVEQIPHATMKTYPQCAHAPFIENAAEFNADLAAFVRGV